jgi:SHS2 domain-containing protein
MKYPIVSDVLTMDEVFEAVAKAHPEAVYRVETLEDQEDGTKAWQNIECAKVIIMTGGKALYVDDANGYDLLDDLETLDHPTVRLVWDNS